MPLQGWFQESASKSEAYSVFYVTGRLASRDINDKEVFANNTPKDVQGTATTDFLQSIRVYPKGMECPVYVKRRDFDRSQLDEKSAIIDAQVSATFAKCAERVVQVFKDIATSKKRVVNDSEGTQINLTVPDGHFFGDKSQAFDTPKNIKLFRKMMIKAQEMAENQNLRIAIVTGVDGATELANAEKFSSKDFGEGETRKTGQPLKTLLGGQVERLFGFDKGFYPNGTETEGKIIVMIEKSLGQDNKDVSVQPEVNYIADKKAYLLDVEVYNSTELLNPEGIFVFTYKRETDAAAAA